MLSIVLSADTAFRVAPFSILAPITLAIFVTFRLLAAMALKLILIFMD
ncbi:MAG: hypothetical protein IPI63_08260 [Methanothrix sp.]|nr:hypothetical protein [Methanothrix sp.]MBK7386707.1 hypothetical protein [Methanothrix sp.]